MCDPDDAREIARKQTSVKGFLIGAAFGVLAQILHGAASLPGNLFFATFLPVVCCWIGGVFAIVTQQLTK